MTNLSIKLYGFITGLLQREEGQDLVEYAVLVGAIGIAAGVALFFFLSNDVFVEFRDTIKGCIQFDDVACDLP